MLTKFLLSNHFPVNTFHTRWGSIYYYSISKDNIKINLLSNSDDSNGSKIARVSDIKVVEINPTLFETYMDIYGKIFDELKGKTVIEYVNKISETSYSKWGDLLFQDVVKKLPSSFIFPFKITGVIIRSTSSGGYNLPIGEEVYIERTTSTRQHIKTVDNLKLQINIKDIELKSSENTEAKIEKYQAVLGKIRKEYKEFIAST